MLLMKPYYVLMRLSLLLICGYSICSFYSCRSRDTTRQYSKMDSCYVLEPFSIPKPAPLEWEWQARHPEELHVPIRAYIDSRPVQAKGKKHKLYVVKIGDFDPIGNSIYKKVCRYLHDYFQIEVDTLGTIPLTQIPRSYTRTRDQGLQLNSLYLLDSVLVPSKPDSALAVIAFSLYDLYPDEHWNYVFGQASLNKGAGVWSLARLGAYRQNPETYNTCLIRTLQVAAHETGHILGITHCIRYKCCMNGSNSLAESDGQPEWLCWECLAKLCWNRNINPETHLKALLHFHQQETKNEACIAYYQKANKLFRVKAAQ